MKELDSKRVAEGGNKSLTDDQCNLFEFFTDRFKYSFSIFVNKDNMIR